jgi:hypothetical protein
MKCNQLKQQINAVSHYLLTMLKMNSWHFSFVKTQFIKSSFRPALHISKTKISFEHFVLKNPLISHFFAWVKYGFELFVWTFTKMPHSFHPQSMEKRFCPGKQSSERAWEFPIYVLSEEKHPGVHFPHGKTRHITLKYTRYVEAKELTS